VVEVVIWGTATVEVTIITVEVVDLEVEVKNMIEVILKDQEILKQ
jgi:hypothetical protein